MSAVEVRRTIPADLDALANILVRVHAIDGYPVEGVAAPRTWIDLPEALGQWTALLDGEPVGHVAVMPPGPGDLAPGLLAKDVETLSLPEIAVVARLFVDPRARRREAAKRLLDVVEAWALRRGLTPALDVMKKDGAAIHLYESRGWHLLGEVEHPRPDSGSEPAYAYALRPLTATE